MQEKAIFTQIQEDLELLYQFKLPVNLSTLVCNDSDIEYLLKSNIIKDRPVSDEEVYYREKNGNIELSIYLSDKITERIYSKPQRLSTSSYDYTCIVEGFSHAFHILRRKFFDIKTTRTGLEAIGEIDKFCLVSLNYISGTAKTFRKGLLDIVFQQFFDEINLKENLPLKRVEIYQVAFKIARFHIENELIDILSKDEMKTLGIFLRKFASLSLEQMISSRDLPLAS